MHDASFATAARAPAFRRRNAPARHRRAPHAIQAAEARLDRVPARRAWATACAAARARSFRLHWTGRERTVDLRARRPPPTPLCESRAAAAAAGCLRSVRRAPCRQVRRRRSRASDETGSFRPGLPNDAQARWRMRRCAARRRSAARIARAARAPGGASRAFLPPTSIDDERSPRARAQRPTSSASARASLRKR